MLIRQSAIQRIIFALSTCCFSFVHAQYALEVVQIAKGMPLEVVSSCEVTTADFGPRVANLTLGEYIGCGYPVQPADACAADVHVNATIECPEPFAIVAREHSQKRVCTFAEQVYNVQNSKDASFKLVIFYNYQGPPVPMGGGAKRELVHIPMVMISHSCAIDLLINYPVSNGYRIRLVEVNPYIEAFKFVLPIIILVVICTSVLGMIAIVRWCREHHRQSLKRLPKRLLRKIPVRRYRKDGSMPDTCAICLDDFIVGEKVRQLICRHTYHPQCIDPWLTENRKVCPMCKRGVDGRECEEEHNRQQNLHVVAAPATPSAAVNIVVDETPAQSSLPIEIRVDVHEQPTFSGPSDSREHLVPSDSDSDETENVIREFGNLGDRLRRLIHRHRSPQNSGNTAEQEADGERLPISEHEQVEHSGPFNGDVL